MEDRLIIGVDDSTAASKGRNCWPILQGNVTSANLEKLQQLEVVTVKIARGVFLYKVFPSHG